MTDETTFGPGERTWNERFDRTIEDETNLAGGGGSAIDASDLLEAVEVAIKIEASNPTPGSEGYVDDILDRADAGDPDAVAILQAARLGEELNAIAARHQPLLSGLSDAYRATKAVPMAGGTPAASEAKDSPTLAAEMLRRLADSRWAEGHRDTDPLHAAAEMLSKEPKPSPGERAAAEVKTRARAMFEAQTKETSLNCVQTFMTWDRLPPRSRDNWIEQARAMPDPRQPDISDVKRTPGHTKIGERR